MKTIGLIGGMSWESSAVYYQLINRKVKERLGGSHSCQCLLYSVDFEEVAQLQHAGNWAELGRLMADAGQRLEKGGADFIVLCTNTMHKVADEIAIHTNIPLLHIADAVALEIQQHKLKKIGLLGTKFTMEEGFMKQRLHDLYQIATIIPSAADRDSIHQIIYEELVHGVIEDKSRQEYLRIIRSLQEQGAEGIILGCTEIGLLITDQHTDAILFDTLRIHAEKAVEVALQEAKKPEPTVPHSDLRGT